MLNGCKDWMDVLSKLQAKGWVVDSLSWNGALLHIGEGEKQRNIGLNRDGTVVHIPF